MTIHDALTNAAPRIARRDAETLLSVVLGSERAWVLAHPEAELDAPHAETFFEFVTRRDIGEPLQYITGVQEFYGLELHVTPDVLIPRPETEHLIEAVLAWAAMQPDALRIVDIGTGSGAIAIALAAHLPSAEVIATDISPSALAVARGNAERLGFGQRIRFVQSDLLSGVDAEIAAGMRFDVVASNPPYIPAGDAAEMQREVVAHEPHTALFAGKLGLDIYQRLIPAAHSALRGGGLLAMEIGFGQRHALEHLLIDWADVRFVDDYASIPRIVLAEKV
ncbi:MAG TPA: peptide chain release factor N(5)-glutamine methyltransferase [Granulicella sp.]